MTKDKILKAAMTLFAKKGYEGTTLTDIAKAVGIQKPSIYNHFKSKEEIFLKIYEDILWVHFHKIEKLMEEIKDEPSNEQLYQILMLTCQYYLDYKEQSTFLNRANFFAPEGLKEKIQNQFMDAEEKMSQILRKTMKVGMECGEIRKGNIEDFIMSFYCLIDGIFIEFSYYGAEKMIPRISNIWKNFWYGLKND